MSRTRTWAVALAIVTVTATAVICRLAWELAPGVVQVGPSDFRTDFLEPRVMKLVWLLPLAVAGVSALDPRVGAVTGVAGLVPVTVAVHAEVEQYAVTGWGDGLEVLGYLLPVLLAVLCLALGVLGGLLGRGLRRRRQGQ